MDDMLNNFLERFWSWRLESAPEFSTAVGIHKHDALLNDHSLEAYARRLQDVKKFIVDLEKIDANTLNKENKLNFELLHLELTTFVNGSQYNSHLFPINSLEGPQLELARTISWMKQEKDSDFQKILSRYKNFPTQAEQIIKLLEKGIKTGYVNSKISMQAVPNQIKALVETPATESRFFEPFKKLESVEMGNKAVKIIEEELYPAFRKLNKYITQTYIPACRDQISCTALPSGEAFYETALKFHLTTAMTADQVHQTGLNEVERIRKRMHEVMKEVGFEGALEEFFQFLRTDPRFYHTKKEHFLGGYHVACDAIKKLLPRFFGTIPKSEFAIKELPSEGAASAPGAFYYAGSSDGTRPGTFFVNCHMFEKRPNYEFYNLSLHEANPGHHLQASVAIEQEGLPCFRQFFEDTRYYEVPGRFSIYTAFVEGWGLYSEYLGEEMGVYKTPYDLFGRLSAEIFRACRLVVDTGMHKKGWSREQAVEFMTKNSAMSAIDISAEIDRYITWPGQACAYKIGEIKFRELREKARAQTGEKFDVRLFHDAILSQGAVPIAVLERIVDTFIEKYK